MMCTHDVYILKPEHINSLALLFSRAQYSKIRSYGDYTKNAIIFDGFTTIYLQNALIYYS